MPDTELRLKAAELAVASGAKDVVKTATDILGFLTAGNASSPTSKPAAETEKPAKAAAQKATENASTQSSDKSAASTATDTPKATSPSSGFAEDGAEITLADVRAAAVKFVSANDEQALLAALGEFGAPNMSGLPVDKYAEFLEKISLPAASVFE